MAQSVTMTYGDYSFSPVPLISIERESYQAGNRDLPLGYTFVMTMNGTLTPLPNTTGILELDDLMEELRTAFNRDGKLLEIKCDATTVMQIYPRIRSISFQESDNNWVMTVPFTIQLEYDHDEVNEHPNAGTDVPPYISEYTEEWQMEFVEENKYFVWDLSSVTNQVAGYDYSANDSNNPFEARVTHTMTAKGKQSWAGPAPALTGTSTSAAENAMNWLVQVFDDFDYNSSIWGHAQSGWNNLANGGTFGEYDHMRSHVINETDGSVSLTESWIIIGDNTDLDDASRRITEDFTVNITRSAQDGKVNVSVDGQIQGRENRDYSVPSSLSPVASSGRAYDNASTAWDTIQDRVFPRAQFIFEQDFSTRLNPNPMNLVVGHQPSRGIITYSYQFDDRPCAFITGALSETFIITDNHPTDVFASLGVLGRAQGPVLQEISTFTEATREISIEAVMPQPTGCSSITDLDMNKPSENVENILCQFEGQLTAANNQVFKHSDTESWSPIDGRYSRTVGWTYSNCATSGDTSFCD